MGLYSNDRIPGVRGVYEDRLAFAGCPATPARGISRTGDYENFAQTDTDGVVTDSHALSYTLNSDEVQNVQWIKGDEKALVLGTVDGEWPMRPSTASEAMTPPTSRRNNPPRAGVPTSKGSGPVTRSCLCKPLNGNCGNSRTSSRRTSLKPGSYGVVRAHHQRGHGRDDRHQSPRLPEATTVDRVGRTQRWSAVVLYVRAGPEGARVGAARSRRVLESTLTTPAIVESVACMPSADGTRDEVWVSVKRFINGRTSATSNT